MRVKFTAPFDYVTLRTKSGTPRATVAYSVTDEPITVKREHGEAAVVAGKAVEVDDVAKRDSDAAGILAGLNDVSDGKFEITFPKPSRSAKSKGQDQ